MDNLNYGVIGNCKSAALISKTGCIEWACLPDFDSPSFFARLLDINRGGEFGIEVDGNYDIIQSYIPKTNILKTTYVKGPDCFEVHDFMPRYHTANSPIHCPPDIIRYVRHISGRPQCRILYRPRPCYGQYDTKTEVRKEYIKTGSINGSYESIYLYSDLPLPDIADSKTLTIDCDGYFLVSYNQKLVNLDIDWIQLEYEKTRVYWLEWSAKTPKFHHYNDAINRSLLVLKLLAYQNSGAILAAVTTSLPETIGEERNWDYRFCWLRDASMTIATLTRMNHYNVARRFMDYIINMISFKDEKIQIMYGIRGQRKLTERILSFLDGYEGSRPVRIGNAAYTQKQNDIYGVLLDSIHLYLTNFKRGIIDIQEDLWTITRSLARHVEHNWYRTDMGIWEFRTRKKHFTFSKILSWVAMDRAVKIAQLFQKQAYIEVWTKMRQKIKRDILAKGWSEKIQAFTQSYGDEQLDAANLLMEYYGFIDPADPRFVSTVLKTQEKLCRDGLMYRYINEDDFGKPSSAFTCCTFWMIRSLIAIGRRDEAVAMFEEILQYRNHVGLFSEDIDFESKRLLGNFPQGYSHLALINAATCIIGKEKTDKIVDLFKSA